MNDDDDRSLNSSRTSSSSDDEFLTSGAKGGIGKVTQQDREALVRKKLLESFYGTTSSISTPGHGGRSDRNDHHSDVENENMDDDDDDDDDEASMKLPSSLDAFQQQLQLQQPRVLSPSHIPQPYTATKSDLDSPNFNSKSHTLSHIAHSTTHTLLETNEKLALDIRTLDSTMQTLVYENYSKFIDATDAIKSIGINVSSVSNNNQHGLNRLVIGMERIQAASEKSEELLRLSRDAVAEKIRIQRLLTRLDALLSLPLTLRAYIRQGKYSNAVQSHMNATEILGKHSAGFESLRSIESECGDILIDLVTDLKGKLLRWSGIDAAGNAGNGKREWPDRVTSYLNESDESILSRPASIGDIFECARTLIMLIPTPFSPGLGRRQCQSLTLAACGIFLANRLVVEDMSDFCPQNIQTKQKNNKQDEGIIKSEIPIAFLDGLLEAATLFRVSFHASSVSVVDTNNVGHDLLERFISTNFDKFISHVYALMVQKHEVLNNVRRLSSDREREDEEEESNDDANFLRLSISLSHLLRSVRELASGLTLPEVGIDVALSSTLVNQAVELAEMLVTRRIAIKFYELRVLVITECLTPLVKTVLESGTSEHSIRETKVKNEWSENLSDNDLPRSSSLVDIVQLASAALSDGLQMADDLIRATLQRSLSATTPVELAVLKQAVQKSSKAFGLWLAAALETLVGCEGSLTSGKSVLEIIDSESEDEKKGQNNVKIILSQLDSQEEEIGGPFRAGSSFIHSTPLTGGGSSVKASVEKDDAFLFLSQLLVQLDYASGPTYAHFLLAICEMCRLAERSMANTLNQSIQSAMDDARVIESAKKLFGDSINLYRKEKNGLDTDQILPQRFKLAASRSLAMYVMDRGASAASELCSDIFYMSDARDPYAIPSSPREACTKIFQIAKASCEDCISIVGGDLFVAPVAPFPDEDEYMNVFGNRLVVGGTGIASSGLQLDVERMFIEKSKMFPHTLDQLEFTRNSVVSGILRVSLFAFLECVRYSVFSSFGYRQMKVDAVFLRYVIPHFVKDEFGTSDHNARSCLLNTLDDIVLKAGQRCFDYDVTNDDEYYDVEKDEIYTPYQIVQRFCEGEDGVVMDKVAFSSFK